MSFPTVPDHLMKDFGKKSSIEKVANNITNLPRNTKMKSVGILDSFSFLVIVFLYFFFTGLALVIGRKLPSKWLQMGYGLNAGRIGKKILDNKAAQEKTEVESKRTFKVVDLETKIPVGYKTK